MRSNAGVGTGTVDRIRGQLLETLRGVFEPGSRVALLDFPNHANVGDTAIYLGERAALATLGCDIAYLASAASYHPEVMRERLGPDGVILLHGGGNLGDLWPRYNNFRKRVISEQKRYQIVLLPQTLHYDDAANAASDAETFASHPRLAFLLRDNRSLAFAQERFPTVRSALCPDAAFALGRLVPAAAQTSVLVLGRTDHEARPVWPPVLPSGVSRTDWPPPTPAMRHARTVSRALGFPIKRAGRFGDPLVDPLRRLYGELATRRLTAGLDLLSSAEVLVTDRLHGHILALLLGRPSVLLDNSYGKNRGFYDAWTSTSSIVSWADDAAGALEAGLARAAAHRSEVLGQGTVE